MKTHSGQAEKAKNSCRLLLATPAAARVTNTGPVGSPYLDHGDHALVGDGVGADGEVARGVPADDAVDGVPVGRVRLVPVHHRQVGHHNLHSVLWHFP